MSTYFKMKIYCIIILSIVLTNPIYSTDKSLYVVRMANNDYNLIAFEIDGNQLNFQAQTIIPEHGWGAVDIEIDPDSKILFVCFENHYITGGGNVIELFHASSLSHRGTIVLDGPTNVTGLAYDAAQHKLYCTERTNTTYDLLYVYDWDSEYLTLTEDPCNPYTLSDNAAGNDNGTSAIC